MKVLVIGCGNIGRVAAKDLAKSMRSTEIVVADNDENRAKIAAEKIGTDNTSWIRLDATNQKELAKTLKDFDLIMGFLPGKLGYGLIKACIEAKKSLVDVSYMDEDPLDLNKEATKAGITIVPDCGLAPGISNVLVGHAVEELDEVKAVRIMVGGLPTKPTPPLDYIITWSPESLIDEYTRKARIVEKGRKTEVDALTGLEKIEFPKLGKLEAFYTDGLRTLIQTVDAEEMWEKTLRFPGHAEKIKLLISLGFFDEENVKINELAISPRKLAAKLLEQKLRKPSIRDLVALRVEVDGQINDEHVNYVHHLLDYYDEKQDVTAMARTTAYPASITAQLILRGYVKEKGILPPERIGMNNKLFRSFVAELEKRNINQKMRKRRIIS